MDHFARRFHELEQDLVAIGATRKREQSGRFGERDFVNQEMFDKVRVKIKSTIVDLCTIESTYYNAFVDAEQVRMMDSNHDIYVRIKSVFEALRDDYMNGYLVKYKSLVQSEVFADQIEQAQELLASNYYVAAAVISGIVLETKLRDVAIANGLEIGKLDKMNVDLCKKGNYNPLVQKQITAIAAIRNSAAHGKIDEFTNTQVKTMIEQVTQIVSSL